MFICVTCAFRIVTVTNLKSINLFAEAMVKIIGLIKTGEGSAEAGIRQITAYWSGKGIDMDGFAMKDGSGLSRKNKVTTLQLTEMLRAATKTPAYQTFYASLPVAGKSGTLAGLLKGTFADGNLRAKQGRWGRCGPMQDMSPIKGKKIWPLPSL